MHRQKMWVKHFPMVVSSVILGSLLYGIGMGEATRLGVFGGFTGHINQQIMMDKRQFVAAESCTQWFYHQLRKRPPSPDVQLLPFPTSNSPGKENECPAQYPNGLEDARQAFSETQSSLSLSLTFYQFALVGDADDDGEYSDAELQDVFESLEMLFEVGIYPADYILALNQMFDSVRQTGRFPILTKGIERLYEKGYRFTPTDQTALNQVTQ